MFQTWGSDAIAYDLIGARKSKAAPREVPVKFLRYNETNDKGFRLLKKNGDIINSKDVKFLGTFGNNSALLADSGKYVESLEPKNYAEAMASSEKDMWKDAYKKELSQLQAMEV